VARRRHPGPTRGRPSLLGLHGMEISGTDAERSDPRANRGADTGA
jgi:hypothetical protein